MPGVAVRDRSRHVPLLVLLLALTLALAACGSDGAAQERGPGTSGGGVGDSGDDDPGDEDPAGDEEEAAEESHDAGPPGEGLTVVAPAYPLAWVAERIAPGAEVHLLTGTGEDPHDIELSPRGREVLETADVVVHMGDIGYQPQVERAAQAAGGEVVAFSDAVGEEALLGWDDDHREGDEDGHDDPEDGHDDPEDGHDDPEDGHDDPEDGHDDEGDGEGREGTPDPHAWLDARLMAELTTAVGEAFAAADAGRADDYRARAGALAEDFSDLADETAALFEAGCAHDRVIVSHEAYAYLLEPYGLRQEGVSGVDGHGPASPQRIAELVRTVRDEGIEHVLAEPVEGREDAAAVADEAGIELLDIYSLEVVHDEGLFAEHGFHELLRQQAQTVATAIGCAQDPGDEETRRRPGRAAA